MTRTRRLQLYFVLVGIVIGVFSLTISAEGLWANRPLVYERLHTAIEAMGALAAIVMAMFLILNRHENYGGKLFLLGMGFLSMGLIDVFHSVSPAGQGFVLLRSTASLIGAFWFVLIWLPWCASDRDAAWKRWCPWALAVAAISVGIWPSVARNSLPLIVQDGTFTSTADVLNLISGLFFLAAAIRLLIDFGRIGKREIYVFACIAMLFGLANLTFPSSALWDVTWWFWHVLRLVSYVLVLGFVIHEHQQAISDVQVTLAERKKAEDWLHILIATTQDAVISINPFGRIVLFNPAAERIFGYAEPEVQGQKVNVLMDEPYASEHDEYIARFERTNDARAIGHVRTVTGRRKNGEAFPIEISITQIRNDEEVRYAAFIRDISEKERLQNQLIENERLAVIGITSAKFAHEIANPLNGMAMTAQLLERRLARQGSLSDEKVSSALQTVNKEIKHLNNLLNDFRFLYRRETYNFKPTPLTTVIQGVLTLESPECTARGIQVEQYCAEDLPLVMADKEKLEEALLNLCRNAAEAMPNGGKMIVRALSSSDQVILEVEDTGIGIPDGIDILEPFATTKPSGTGLGLVIVRQILAAHKGAMTYASELGKGTVFTLTLPAASVAVA